MAQKIVIERVDHIGVRVRDLDRALAFYEVLGFELLRRAEGDDVAIICNEHGVELNLVFNANSGDQAANILIDVPDKFPGYTHIALRVASIPATIAALKANDIAITQGPVSFGEAGHVSVFIRDPDRNVIELRGRDQGRSRALLATCRNDSRHPSIGMASSAVTRPMPQLALVMIATCPSSSIYNSYPAFCGSV
jgi:lactoylglutathione lyase